MAHLPLCLEALRDQTFTDFETIVVDNASTDGSLDYLAASWPDVRLVKLDSNRGFPAAINAGLRASKGTDYIALLNNDTKADPAWLSTLVAALDAAPAFSFGSSKLLRFDAPATIDSAGHWYSLWLGSGSNLGELESADRYSQPAWVFGTCAAASIYRRPLFDDIGEFDEDFFFAHEDVEFDVRANVAGHRCLLIPDAIVYHKRGASTTYSAPFDLMGVRNRMWLAGKNLPPLALALWVGGKVLRIFWWLPARVLRLWNGTTDTSAATPSRTAPAARLKVRDIIATAAQTARTLPKKRRASRSIRRLRSIELLRVLRATKSSQPIVERG